MMKNKATGGSLSIVTGRYLAVELHIYETALEMILRRLNCGLGLYLTEFHSFDVIISIDS
ncbi:hypothetical protein PPOP_0132 [Paenibacillus popilliae ATCC 14706]|uniref:Uncharacterized protein n=1 Tax=Paenibacillus popilliae ATCC 14706 TaxID=1212764 RepID=M9LF29_PAEPP|nr:hypothetical protein PPOP_0132 [Paenibacillus popilliae ATCC 14706]